MFQGMDTFYRKIREHMLLARESFEPRQGNERLSCARTRTGLTVASAAGRSLASRPLRYVRGANHG